MTEDQQHSVMRRKASSGQPSVVTAPATAARAIPLALARTAEGMGLPLRVAQLRESRMVLAELPEALEEFSLLAVIEGPKEGLGLVALPPATLSALIEFQTLGVLARSAPTPRKPTRIDAAMAAEFIDGALTRIEAELSATDEAIWAGGFRYASCLDGPRPLGLLLEDTSYRVWQADLVFGAEGERAGGFLWAVPAEGRGQRPAAMAQAVPNPARTDEDTDWMRRMEATLMGTSAVLDAVLDRVTVPLAAVLHFAPGTLLPIAADSLERLQLEGHGRRALGRARLGQLRGFRAVRLVDEGAQPGPARAAPSEFDAGTSPVTARAEPPAAVRLDVAEPLPRRVAGA
ncbi:FliM/FliN family flagellar motor C-terminal domain-containing protein [Sedimentimonas flavescens]|uniref:FliM/FliN family flagellar motor C-terminal domain-containing protein n=2 Tax=Sedimentimonas flavescens TaxID=2851012 RepID=A0ABT2ZXT0_9RHOB|nr:FliM/FliN family flagellar motor C-terminal domain-containing protein [Sedimentimonas flavescens]